MHTGQKLINFQCTYCINYSTVLKSVRTHWKSCRIFKERIYFSIWSENFTIIGVSLSGDTIFPSLITSLKR